MKTSTHSDNGQYLPSILQNREIEIGTYLVDEDWYEMGGMEIDEIHQGLRALEITTETDMDGLYVVAIG